ncbi:copper oxidase [Polyangium aurulentum]|nr:copper oxidase [Polyangium aurulentum]
MSRGWGSLLWAGIVFLTGCGEDASSVSTSGASDPGDAGSVTQVEQAVGSGRTVTARVVALDQPYVYNRFGSFNPVGMIYALERDVEPIDPARGLSPGNVRLRHGKRPRPLVLRANVGDKLVISFTNLLTPSPRHSSTTATRRASVHVDGLQIKSIDALGGNVGKNPSSLANPGETRVYELFADREGTFLMHSAGALSGGQGDAGQRGLGLFGAVNVEPPGSVWFRSQVTAAELAAASGPVPNPDGTPRINYDAEMNGVPILHMLHPGTHEIIRGDLTAIITGVTTTEAGTTVSVNEGSFRELTECFHDEIEAVQAFKELDADPTLQSVRDAFAINYGASGMGAEILANRKRIGPSKDCVECKFEEFFLTSWANGDPAMNVDRDANGNAVEVLFPDDPSNVHHSYLSDPVRIRNVHVGKETHVFHLHGHQWFREPGNEDATLLDSQSIGPGAGFTYNINFGSGNRSLSIGDAIFHCHLYPHFAQGMWGLWRVHDVFENGGKDRNLPDGEIADGTPTPAVVPIPGRAMPPMPTYAPQTVTLPDGKTATRPAMPGYPHYMGAIAGHRPSQPPLDMDHDGGLPRHLVANVPPGGAIFGERGEFDVEITRADIKLLPENGTGAEQQAILFHAGGFPGAAPAVTRYGFPAKSYPAFTPEGAPARFLVNGQPPKPGAPYADPCPAGIPERKFRIAYVQTDGVVNKAGWHDPQMRIKVLEQDIEATLKRTRPLEPLFIRAHSGDCVITSATNLLPANLEEDDFQIFTPTDIIGEHVHLVKFDLTSSDGAANGFNYEDGTFAAEEVVALIEAANQNGGAFVADGSLTPKGTRVQLAPSKHPRIAIAPLGTQSTLQRWWADPLPNAYGKDRAVRTAFAHDHMSPSSHQHHGLYSALVVEPAGTTWRDPATGQLFGTRADGGPTSFRADILYPGDVRLNHREFNLAIADFAIVYDAQNNPVNPPTAMEAPLPIAVKHAKEPSPEAISERDPGTQLFNYRNEPIPLRIGERDRNGFFVQRNGAAGQMENVFLSSIHGDPFTPILEAYALDRVRINLIQGAQEEQHVFSVHGTKWHIEPLDPDSGYVNSQGLGISEHFEFVLKEPKPASPGDSVDHLYQSAPTENLWDGLWGLLRVYRHNVNGLLPLPGNPAPFTPVIGPPTCPANAPVRSYTVHAVLARDLLPEKRLVYNPKFKLYDPDGMLFVKEEHLEELKSGLRRPEPLVLRAAAGDCIKVTLVNDLPQVLPKTPHWNYNTPLIDGFNTNQVASSNHVSLHPQLVAYDVDDSDGANVGRNSKQTVPPKGKRTYTWYAGEVIGKPGTKEILSATPIEFGSCNLRDMADVVNHGMHGAIGALIVEPQGASWTPDAGTEAQANVSFKDAKGVAQSFRELVVVYQDEVGMHSDDPRFQCADRDLNCGTAIRNIFGEDDAEDSGHKAFNYRSEPIWARLGVRPEAPPDVLNALEQGDVLSSVVHGDPATPVFSAKARMPLRIRVLQPSGHARQHAFNLWGAEWPWNPWAEGSKSTVIGPPNPDTFVISTQSVHSAMRSWNILPIGGAGGPAAVPGDYLYRDHPSFQFTDGLWGILRVTP